MKKVLNINNGYPSDKYPNYCTYIKTISECLESAGANVEILVIKYNRDGGILYKLTKYIIFWHQLFWKKLKDYDLVYINHFPFCWPVLFNPTIIKSRTIIHCHGDEIVGCNPIIKRIRSICQNRLSEIRFIVPSNYFKAISSNVLNIPQDHILVSPSGGIDTDVFIPQTCKKKWNEILTLGFSSGLSIGKGADIIMLLVNNAHIIEDLVKEKVHFRVIDYGADIAKYRHQLESQERVTLVPKLPKDKMADFDNSIDILLMPSQRLGESLGLVVLEAMSCDKPVITFNKFAFPEFVISGVSGELVEFSQDKYESLKRFISAIQLIKENYISYQPRSIVLKGYSKGFVINQYKELLSRC